MQFTFPKETLEISLLCAKIYLSSETFPALAGRLVVSAVKSTVLACSCSWLSPPVSSSASGAYFEPFEKSLEMSPLLAVGPWHDALLSK